MLHGMRNYPRQRLYVYGKVTFLSRFFQIMLCHDQESNLGSGSNDSSPEETNHYPEMTECGRNLNYGFNPRPMDKSVIISCQLYMIFLQMIFIVNFNESKRKEEEKIKRKRKKTHILVSMFLDHSDHTEHTLVVSTNHQTSCPIRSLFIVPVV